MATMKKAMKKKKNHTLYSKAQNDLAYTINWLWSGIPAKTVNDNLSNTKATTCRAATGFVG